MNAVKTLEAVRVVKRAKAKRDYYSYVKYTHSDIYKYTQHGEYICNVINDAINKRHDMMDGKIPLETQYIALSTPSQHGKSMHVTETLPSYFIGHFPNHGCIEVSYGDDFAVRFGKYNKQKVLDYGLELFGLSIPVGESSSTEWGVMKDGKRVRGGMISRGIMSGITGSSLGDLIIIDDVIKNSEWANSQTIREKQWAEWQDSIMKRIHPGAIVIIIMTRWHEDDLLGRLLNPEHGKPLNWNYINLPIECDEYHITHEGNPLNRKLGEPLWDSMYGREEIEKRKQYPRSYSCMDMGRPTAAEGNMIKKEWFDNDEAWYTQTPEFLATVPNICMSVDATFKDTSKSDKVAIGIWGKRGNTFYLIDELNARMDFLATLQAIRNLKKQYPQIGMIFIEDKANGPAIINVLSKELMGIVPVNPMGGKESRVQSVLPYLVSNVKLPRNKAYTSAMLQEWYSFPNGAHDDSVDEMTQALSQMIFYYGEVETEKEKTIKDMFFGTERQDNSDNLCGDIF